MQNYKISISNISSKSLISTVTVTSDLTGAGQANQQRRKTTPLLTNYFSFLKVWSVKVAPLLFHSSTVIKFNMMYKIFVLALPVRVLLHSEFFCIVSPLFHGKSFWENKLDISKAALLQIWVVPQRVTVPATGIGLQYMSPQGN